MNWLNELKAGDTVINVRGHSIEYLCTVDRVTATQIIIGAEKYSRSRGDKIGKGTWDTNSLVEATPKKVAKIKESEKCYKLKRQIEKYLEANSSKMNSIQLQLIVDAINKIEAEK